MRNDVVGIGRGGKELRGLLFTRDYLRVGITETKTWAELSEAELDKFIAAASALYANFDTRGQPNEATTEQFLIFELMRLLGWDNFLPQQPVTGRRQDVPDALLFASADARKAAEAIRSKPARYRHGIAILENKAWQISLDRGPADLFNQHAPSSQMLRYLNEAEIQSSGAIHWGILTNGRHWRLYWQGARSKSEEFLEIDLPVLLGVRGIQGHLDGPPKEEHRHLLKVFYCLFRCSAFLPGADDAARSFHLFALERTREWETEVSEELGDIVFKQIFPDLVRAIVAKDPDAPVPQTPTYLGEVKAAAMTLLYRLLFVLYAEDRNLLPAHEKGYADYSLNRLRHEVAQHVDANKPFADGAQRL